jgi:hypothetical protein
MRMLDRRLQLLLSDDQYQKVAFHAQGERVSVAAVIRSLIDRLPSEEEQRRREQAFKDLMSAEPAPVPDDPDEIDRELEEMHLRRSLGWS